ncbi:MAG: hypothetical protein GY842_06365 [bacterium]|nr:hypothetical protein [bacterium]
MKAFCTLVIVASASLTAMLSGCATPPKNQAPRTIRSEVAKVTCFYDLSPFISFDDEGDLDVEGFRVTVVLASRKAKRGVAEDGVIRVKMYRRDVGQDGKAIRTLVREWFVETAGLVTFRSPLFGEGYKLQFRWDPEDDVLGNEIQIVVSYETCDGRTIRSQTKSWRVPAAKN